MIRTRILLLLSLLVVHHALAGESIFDGPDKHSTHDHFDIQGYHQCEWQPAGLDLFPEQYSLSSGVQTQASLSPSSFDRTVDSVHRIVTRFHVVRKSDGSGGVDENLLDAMMTDLNYGFRDSPFVFVRDPELIYIDNDEYYEDFPTFSSAYAMLSNHQVPGIMSWYITPKIRHQVAGTWIGPASPFRGILMRYDTTGTPSFMRLPVHEMAHIFQVYHPFETVFGTECTSGANCLADGDLVCDTPASPALHPGNTTGTGVYYGPSAGPCLGDPPYDPDTSLYMLGGWPAGSILANHFTQGQMDRALLFLNPVNSLTVADLVGPQRPDIVTDCDANGLDDINEILNGEKADINRDLAPDVCQVFTRPGDLVVSGMNPDPNNRLRYFDRETGDWRGDLWNGMNWMHQVRLGPDGLLYLPTQTIITRVDPKTGRSVDNFVDGVREGASLFVDILFEDNGNLLLLDNNNANVRRYNGETGESMGVFFSTAVGTSFAPKYMEFGPDDHIYMVGNGAAGNAVHRFDSNTGQYLGEFVSAGSGGLLSGQGLTFHDDGFLYVSNATANNVLRYHADSGVFDSEFVSGADNGGLNNPHSLRFGPDGHLYVASRNTHSVKRYHRENGSYLGDFVTPRSGGSSGTGQLNQPAGLLFIDPESYQPGQPINAGMNGAWADASTPGQGFFLDVLDSLGQVFLSWFTYEEADTVEANEAGNHHRWLVGVGPFDGNTAQIELSSATGGSFNGPETVTETTAGTARIEFLSCEEAEFEYTLDSGHTRVIALKRVLPDTLCTSLSEGAD